MTTAGVYSMAKDKLVIGENVAQAAMFVDSGNAMDTMLLPLFRSGFL